MDDATPILLTAMGMETLKAELKRLVDRDQPDILAKLAEAREHGDLKENAEYHAAKERKAFIADRITQLTDVLSYAVAYEPGSIKEAPQAVPLCRIKVRNLDNDRELEVLLVHPIEADLEPGRLSYESPLGKELLDKKDGEEFEVDAPAGELSYKLLEITPPG